MSRTIWKWWGGKVAAQVVLLRKTTWMLSTRLPGHWMDAGSERTGWLALEGRNLPILWQPCLWWVTALPAFLRLYLFSFIVIVTSVLF